MWPTTGFDWSSKPICLQVHLSYVRTNAEARANAHDQWRTTTLPAEVGEHLRTPSQFDAAATFVRPDDMDAYVRISAEPDQHVEWLRGDLDLGIDEIFLHNVGRNQREFIAAFAEHVLPSLRPD